MPTGYTAAVSDGTVTDFPDFALQCARAFGALIMMRDEPSNAPIPESFQPSDYSAKKLEKARNKVSELQAMTPEACDVAALADYNAQCESRAARVLGNTLTRERYEAMLTKVNAWEPPTPDHVHMKEFMVEQLESSINFDCSVYSEDPLIQKTGLEWRIDQLATARRDIAYHAKASAEELERTATRNAWVKALRDSLAPITV